MPALTSTRTLISFSGSDSYIRVFFVGLLNTLVVAVVGIFFATILGFMVALGRLSPNWLLSRIAGGYVELVRNLPPLFQILFWYKAVLSALPNPRQSYSFFDSFFLSNRGLVVPKGIAAPGLEPFLIAAAIAIVAAFVLRRYARKELFEKGHKITIWPYVLGLLVGLPVMAVLIFGIPFTLEFPTLRGFNFAGGARVIPEFVALTLALSTYTAAFIAEIVRAGIMSVHKGQMEAGVLAGLVARPDVADGRGAAGHAGDPAAADQPVPQPDQELLACGRDRLSRPRLGVRRHDAEPDRAGDRDHIDHHGRLSADLAHHQRAHEFLRLAA